MNLLLALLATATPSPSRPATPEADSVNAGWLGFVFLLALAIAVAFLARSLITQLGRVKYASVPVDPATDGPVEYETDETDGTDEAASSTTGAPAVDPPPADQPGPRG